MKSRNLTEKKIVHISKRTNFAIANNIEQQEQHWPANHQQKPSSLPDEKKNWKRTKKICTKRGCSAFGKLNLVGQTSAVAAFQQFQLVMTWLWLVIIAGFFCAGANSKYPHYIESVKKKDLPKTWI